MSKPVEVEDEEYVDVRSLPLRPPQPQPPPQRTTRRPWHPVMWDDTIVGLPPPDHKYTAEQEAEEKQSHREYPHKQRIQNLRRLIQQGKVKPDSEMLIFFLCNKFAVSDERQGKISV
ncbi:uncharacterized protein LOC126367430 [Pectinophora gossypiella]|uniref:uncharacterized protein LOC126367430 n=1 Tax=Pectinophora gossypiella TaxID=13191 RepID=UPI00214ECE08|nr:uncharacterized protein LOC126367430 [Pectinophora gossypiella]